MVWIVYKTGMSPPAVTSAEYIYILQTYHKRLAVSSYRKGTQKGPNKAASKGAKLGNNSS